MDQTKARCPGRLHVRKTGRAMPFERREVEVKLSSDKHTDGTNIRMSAGLLGNVKAPVIHEDLFPHDIGAGIFHGARKHRFHEAPLKHLAVRIQKENERCVNGAQRLVHRGAVVAV